MHMFLKKNLNRHVTYHYDKYYNKMFTISNELTGLKLCSYIVYLNFLYY